MPEITYQEQVDKFKGTVTQGQSGKLGFEVRVYAKTIDEMIDMAREATMRMQQVLKELGGE